MNIQKLAKQADAVHDDVVVTPFLRRFADLVLEEAAKVCDDEALAHRLAFLNREAKQADTAKSCAAAIRALKGAKE